MTQRNKENALYKLWHGSRLFYEHLQVLECLVKVAIPTLKKVMIGPKMVDCIFIGYVHDSNRYRFLMYESKV